MPYAIRALGILTAITQELYRKIIGPYEDTKVLENGILTNSSPDHLIHRIIYICRNSFDIVFKYTIS